jgi:hypothetical protein
MPVAIDDHTATAHGWATASPNRQVRLTLAFVALVLITLALVIAEARPTRAQDGGAGAEDVADTAPEILRLDVTVRGEQSRLGPPEVVGDIDGDGVIDYAVGAYSDDLAGEDTGAVYLLLMNADGTVRSQQRVSAGAGGFDGELLAGSGFGFRLAALGDVDDDGTPDLAVSAYRSDRTGPETGEIWVLFLAPDATVRGWQVITDGHAGFDQDLGDGDQLGVDLAPVGDLDGNGVTDLAIGAWRSDADPADAAGDQGAVYLVTLGPDGRTITTSELSPATGWPAPLAVGDGLGVGIDRIGDLDGDGVADLAIGAPGTNGDSGAVHIAFMNADGTVASVEVLTPGTGVVPAMASGDRFGATVASLGDIDGDGFVEIAVGAFGVESFRGAVWVLGLGADATAATARRLPSPELSPDDLFGHTVGAVRRGGGPATALLVGAPGADAAGVDAGAVFVVPLVAEPDEDRPDTGPDGDLDGDGVPNGVEGRIDSDGDGIADRRDRDSDNDGIGDRGELDPETGLDVDTDGDGLVDRIDPDDDGDGIPTALEGRRDPDVDQIPNNEDLDSDGDGIADAVEGAGDADGDGVPNFLDLDSDGDGIDDATEGVRDRDRDGVPNFLDVPDAPAPSDDDTVEEPDTPVADPGVPAPEPEPEPEPDSDGADAGAAPVEPGVSDDAEAEVADEEPDGAEGQSPTDGAATDTEADGTPGGETDSEAIGAPVGQPTGRAALGVRILAPEQLIAGQPNELVLSVVNAGPDVASMAEATMRIPDGVRIDPDQLPEGCSITDDQVVCRLGALEVDEMAVLSIVADVDPGVDDVEFAASIQAPEGQDEGSSGTLGVLNDGIGRAAGELGTPRGALISIVVVALITGAAILALTRQRDTNDIG